MTIQEAKRELSLGKKLCHRFFTDEEYIQKVNGRLVNELGLTLKEHIFWNDRTTPGWITGWELFPFYKTNN
jgi:hypothetical protein